MTLQKDSRQGGTLVGHLSQDLKLHGSNLHKNYPPASEARREVAKEWSFNQSSIWKLTVNHNIYGQTQE